MARIAILDDAQDLATTLADWSAVKVDHDVTIFREHIADPAALIAALQPFDVVCLMRERTEFGADTIAALPSLKLIVTAGMRNAAINMDAASARDIPVCGTPVTSVATAELTIGLMISLARHIATEAAHMRDGGWQSTLGMELSGKTLGIIGLGKLGGQVARVGAALDMNVIAWSQNLTDEAAAAAGAIRVTRKDLLERADVITIHTKLSARTASLIDADAFAHMKPTALLINTSRGPIVDEVALRKALEEGQIAGAALDVFHEEPLPPGHWLRSQPRALLTPHLGYWTRDNLAGWYAGMAEAVVAWANGHPIRVLNAPTGG